MKMNGKQIAERIQQIMRDAEMTQQDLANWLGISQPAVSQYLAGRIPPPDVLFQLSKLGKCSMEWLLTGDANAAPLLAVQEPVPGYGSCAAGIVAGVAGGAAKRPVKPHAPNVPD